MPRGVTENVLQLRVRIKEVKERKTNNGAPWATCSGVHEGESRDGSSVDVPIKWSVWGSLSKLFVGAVGRTPLLKFNVGVRAGDWNGKPFKSFDYECVGADWGGDAPKPAQDQPAAGAEDDLPF